MQTNNAHEYTDEQLQAAIDAAKSIQEGFHPPRNKEERKHLNLIEARAFLAALPKPGHCVEADQKAQPWTLPAPPPGRRWHREDWTQDMLPEGWRPLLLDERTHEEDQYYIPEMGWRDGNSNPVARPFTMHTRTRRPLPAEASAEPEQTKPADDGPPWIPHDGGPCPLKDSEVEEWEFDMRLDGISPGVCPPRAYRWEHTQNSDDIIAYRVIKWRPGHGPQPASKADEPAPAKPGHGWPYDDLLKSMDRPTPAQPWTPKPGDVVRLKSGGPRMTVCGSEETDCSYVAWFVDGQLYEDCLPNECLIPAKEGQP